MAEAVIFCHLSPLLTTLIRTGTHTHTHVLTLCPPFSPFLAPPPPSSSDLQQDADRALWTTKAPMHKGEHTTPTDAVRRLHAAALCCGERERERGGGGMLTHTHSHTRTASLSLLVVHVSADCCCCSFFFVSFLSFVSFCMHGRQARCRGFRGACTCAGDQRTVAVTATVGA